jgi:hypothetical protein
MRFPVGRNYFLHVTAQPASLRALFAKQSQSRSGEIASFLLLRNLPERDLSGGRVKNPEKQAL